MLKINSKLNEWAEEDLDPSDEDTGDKENSEVGKQHSLKMNSVFSHPSPSENVVCLLNRNQAEPQLGKDKAVTSGLLEILVILWKTVASCLQQNKGVQKYMHRKFGGALVKYLKAYTVC